MPRVEVNVISPIVQVTSQTSGVQSANVTVQDREIDVTVQEREIIAYTGKLDSSQYVTRSESGQFYPASNPSGFVTSISGMTKAEADAWYYPLTGNPSGYITPNQTGSFLTTGAANTIYYPRANPSGFAPAHFGVDMQVVRSGDYIVKIQYADASQTELSYDGTVLTGINYGSYAKLILYSGTAVTGIKYV